MPIGHAVKPVAMVAGALISPGTLNTVVIFTVVAAAELLLNDTIFACPCDQSLSLGYGLSFMLVPAAILFLADFPWKLLRKCPPSGIMCSISRRPIGLAVTWLIIGSLQRKYVDCIMEEAADNCEKSTRSIWFQLMGLYFWLVIIIFAFVMVLCRRQKASCISGRSTALEMQIKYEIEEKRERRDLEKKMKYGTTQVVNEEDLSLDALQALQPGLNPKTHHVLQAEELLQPSVLRYLREEDVYNLDVSMAQRCLMRNLLATLREKPELLMDVREELGFQSHVVSAANGKDHVNHVVASAM